MEHCMINGKRCSKCCEVLTLKLSKWSRDLQKRARRENVPDYKDVHTFTMITKISKRRAKKKNKFLVDQVGNTQDYYTCKNLKDGICTNYENRPSMCSKYPNYSNTEAEWKKWVLETDNLIGLYTPDCTYYDKKYFE